MTYEQFVVARLQPLLRYAVMLTGDPHLAEDLVQETMVRVKLQWRRVSAADVPELYVKRMLTNAYVDLRRGSWFKRVVLRPDQEETARVVSDPGEELVGRDYMWRLLAELPARQRAALVLRYYEGLADKDIAEVLQCAVGTVRAAISRALAALRVRLDVPVAPADGPPVGAISVPATRLRTTATSAVTGGEKR